MRREEKSEKRGRKRMNVVHKVEARKGRDKG